MPNGKKAWETRRARYGSSGQTAPKVESWAKGQKKRKAKYGPSGMSLEARERKAAEARSLGYRNRKDFCKYGHRRTLENTRVTQVGKYLRRDCRDCEREIRWPKKYAKMQPPGLIPAGMSNRQYGMHKWWAGARAKHGSSGYSQETLAKIKERMKTNRPQPPRLTHCKKMGHPLLGKNVILRKDGVRLCRVCQEIKKRGRPEWLEIDGVRVSIKTHDEFAMFSYRLLRETMIASHPDKGGTHEKFLKAKAKLQRFLEQEESWYASKGITVPWDKSQNKVA